MNKMKSQIEEEREKMRDEIIEHRKKADEAFYKAWEAESKLNLIEWLHMEKQGEVNWQFKY